MRRLLLAAVVLVALVLSVVWWLLRPTRGESVFSNYVPQTLGKAWSITGSPGSDNLAFVDSTGAVQPRRNCYSVRCFLFDWNKHQLYSPLLHNVRSRAELTDGIAPNVTWQADGIRWSQSIFASADTCYSRMVITNKSPDAKHVSVFAVAVPFTVVGPMEAGFDVSCDTHSSALVVDGKVLFASDAAPDGAAAISGDEGTDITSYLRRGRLPRGTDARGVLSGASGALRFDIGLNAGASKELCFRMPTTEVAPREWKRRAIITADQALGEYHQRWGERLGRVELQVPDRRVMRCWDASLGYLVMLSGSGKPVPGPAKYHSFWVRDAAYMADALYYSGQNDLIPPALTAIRAMQLPSGGFWPKTDAPSDNELDAPGEAIYAQVQQYRRTGDKVALEREWPGILSACRYIRAKRVSSSGILPASVSAEDLGKGDQQHYWDDFWCVRGLKDAAFAASKLGKANDAIWIDAEADSLLRATLASVRISMQCLNSPAYIPNGPQDLVSSAMARGTSCALWPCEVLDLDDTLTRDSFERYWQMLIAPSGGGFVHKNHYWAYAGMDLAQGYIMLGQRERAWEILDWTLKHDPTHGFYSWPEGMSTKNLGLAEGDMPHGWMCAGYVSLVRNMLVRESGKDLVLLSGVPKQWLKPGARIVVRGFPTEIGAISFVAELGQHALEVTFSGAKPAAVCRVILPGNREIVIPAATRKVTIPLN